jgi:methylmalonyl-CoA mutase N-terminal domain/subunit
MRDRFGATNPRAQQMRFHTQTAGSTLTAQQPDNNIVRVAVQAMAAVLGGTQSLHCNGRDEALSLPTEEAARIALRTQQVIASETGVTNTVDPVAGSYTIERMTDQLEADARALLDRIDALGGTLVAIESGYVQREVQDAAYRAQQAIDAGDEILVGVNRFTDDEPPAIETFLLDSDVERDQKARLAAVRASRSASALEAALVRVERAARGSDNLVPPILAAVEAKATVGEISDTMRRVFGEYIAADAQG